VAVAGGSSRRDGLHENYDSLASESFVE